MSCGLAILWSLGLAQAPVIQSLSATSLPRSGRLRIFGMGFGALSPTSYVTIGGVRCWTTRWTDSAITAYVPELLADGSHPVQVVTGGGASNTVPIQVLARVPQGRVRWRFQADADYIYHRPAVGTDGTIVLHDSRGYVYYSIEAPRASLWRGSKHGKPQNRRVASSQPAAADGVPPPLNPTVRGLRNEEVRRMEPYDWYN